nr:hypothetical protein [Candidatus Njordarchaeota archaeon]
MLFITYYELNPDLDPSEIADLAQKLISKGVYPPKGQKTLAWYQSTGDNWGIMAVEVESAEASAIGTNMWRIAKPGIFKCIKSTLAMKAEDLIPIAMKLSKQIKG